MFHCRHLHDKESATMETGIPSVNNTATSKNDDAQPLATTTNEHTAYSEVNIVEDAVEEPARKRTDMITEMNLKKFEEELLQGEKE